MSLTIDYYFAPQSPWTYLGHARLTDLAAQFKAEVNVLPVDLGGKVFPISGGLPLGARAPQRHPTKVPAAGPANLTRSTSGAVSR